MAATLKNNVRGVTYSTAALYVNIAFASVIIFVIVACIAASAYVLQADGGLLAKLIGMQASPIVRLLVVLPLLGALIVVARAVTSIRRSLRAITNAKNRTNELKRRAVLDQ